MPPADLIWREGATAGELDAVLAIDRRIAALASQRGALTRLRALITNRAHQRERYRRKVAKRKEET